MLLSMTGIQNFLDSINSIVWVPTLLILLMGTRIYLTVHLGLLQLFKLPLAIKFLFEKNEEEYNAEGDVTSFASLCTA